MAISKRVRDRISTQLKRYQTVLADAKSRDISESDTAVIVGDMLSDVFGYKKYSEITTEYAIRGTYVDLAIKVGEDVRFLVETKATGISLKDNHVKQTIDYGANHGVEWVVLTNGIIWRIYKVFFRQPIDKSLVIEIDLLNESPRDLQLLECLGNLSREGFTPSSMNAFFQQQQATSKFSLAALLLTDPLLRALRRELRHRFPKVKVHEEFLGNVLRNDVIKRELVDSEAAHEAINLLKHARKVTQRAKLRSEPLPTATSSTVEAAGAAVPTDPAKT